MLRHTDPSYYGTPMEQTQSQVSRYVRHRRGLVRRLDELKEQVVELRAEVTEVRKALAPPEHPKKDQRNECVQG
jgi:hypothetical protein